MNSAQLLKNINNAFSDIEFGSGYTLLERDIAASLGRAFDNPPNYMEVKEWLSKAKNYILTMGFSDQETKEALVALEKSTRMKNPYEKWLDIPESYFQFNSASGFDSKLPVTSFIFYTPALIRYEVKYLLKNETSKFFIWWLWKLESELKNNFKDFLSSFNKEQIECIIDFLEFRMSICLEDEEDVQFVRDRLSLYNHSTYALSSQK